MTYYIRNIDTAEDFLLKHIDVPIGKVTLEDKNGEKVVKTLADVIENYEFRYDFW